MDTGDEPCLQAVLDDVVVRVDDFRDEPTFPTYGLKVALAAYAAAANLAGREGEQLQSALPTRDRIGQAKSIIMERFALDDV